MAKVLLVLYPDPVTGYPLVYARDSIPVLHGYPGGQIRRPKWLGDNDIGVGQLALKLRVRAFLV